MRSIYSLFLYILSNERAKTVLLGSFFAARVRGPSAVYHSRTSDRICVVEHRDTVVILHKGEQNLECFFGEQYRESHAGKRETAPLHSGFSMVQWR